MKHVIAPNRDASHHLLISRRSTHKKATTDESMVGCCEHCSYVTILSLIVARIVSWFAGEVKLRDVLRRLSFTSKTVTAT